MDSIEKTFIIIGRSGCGKGTQVELLKEKLSIDDKDRKILHIETGALFRKLLQTESYTQKLTKEIVEIGGLMPEVMAISLWSNYMIQNYTGEENLIFDGCPRKVIEAQLLDSMIKFYKASSPTIIYINVSRKWAEERLTARGRKDDSPEGIESRMNWFDKEVAPVIDFFRNDPAYRFVDINGEQAIEQVKQDIFEKIF